MAWRGLAGSLARLPPVAARWSVRRRHLGSTDGRGCSQLIGDADYGCQVVVEISAQPSHETSPKVAHLINCSILYYTCKAKLKGCSINESGFGFGKSYSNPVSLAL